MICFSVLGKRRGLYLVAVGMKFCPYLLSKDQPYSHDILLYKIEGGAKGLGVISNGVCLCTTLAIAVSGEHIETQLPQNSTCMV